MSGRRMDWHRALGVLVYNYGSGTVHDDPEWAEAMIEYMLGDKDKREYCRKHGLRYPPKEFWDEFFQNRRERR